MKLYMHFDSAQCKQKGTALPFLLIILIAIGIAGIVYFKIFKRPILPVVQPIVKVAPKLSTYSNQVLGIEFQYSKDLTVKEDSEAEFNKRGNGDFRKNFKGYVGYEPGIALGAVIVLVKEQDFETNPFSVWVFDNLDNLTKEAWFDRYWYYPFVWGVFDYTSKGHIALDTEATISGDPAKYKIVSYQPGKPKFVYLADEKKMYLLKVVGEEGDKILATIKLLK